MLNNWLFIEFQFQLFAVSNDAVKGANLKQETTSNVCIFASKVCRLKLLVYTVGVCLTQS